MRLTRPDGDAVKVTVQDDGAGIPQDELHLVFDRYRHGPKGTGLGLAICKEFVELHGGEIWAESPPEGGGMFVFTLPMAQEAVRKKPEPKQEQQQPRVLVVEDEAEIAAVLAGGAALALPRGGGARWPGGRGQGAQHAAGSDRDGRVPAQAGRPGGHGGAQVLHGHGAHPHHPPVGAPGRGREGPRAQPGRGGLHEQALQRDGAAQAHRARAQVAQRRAARAGGRRRGSGGAAHRQRSGHQPVRQARACWGSWRWRCPRAAATTGPSAWRCCGPSALRPTCPAA